MMYTDVSGFTIDKLSVELVQYLSRDLCLHPCMPGCLYLLSYMSAPWLM